MSDQQKWTEEETKQVVASLAKGLSPTAIGREINRSRDSVRHRIKWIKSHESLVPTAIVEVKKEEERQTKEPKPLKKKEKYHVSLPPVEYCLNCHSPVSNWDEHLGRMSVFGCKRSAA